MKIFVNGDLFKEFDSIYALILNNTSDRRVYWSYSASRDLVRNGDYIEPGMLATSFLLSGDLYTKGVKMSFSVMDLQGNWAHHTADDFWPEFNIEYTPPCNHNFVNVSFNQIKMVCSKCNIEQEPKK